METRAQPTTTNIQAQDEERKQLKIALLFKQLQDEVKTHAAQVPGYTSYYRGAYLNLHQFLLTRWDKRFKESQRKSIFDNDTQISSSIEPNWYLGARDIWVYANHLGHYTVIQYMFSELKRLFREIPDTIKTMEELRTHLVERKRSDDYTKIANVLSGFTITNFSEVISDFPAFLLNGRVDWSDDVRDEMTPLMLAVRKDNSIIAASLISSGAKVWGERYYTPPENTAPRIFSRAKELHGRRKVCTALSHAILHSNDIEIVKILLKHVEGPIDPISMKYALQTNNQIAIKVLILREVLPSLNDLLELNLAENSASLHLFLAGNPSHESTQKRLRLMADYAVAKDFLHLWQKLIITGLTLDHRLQSSITMQSPRIFNSIYAMHENSASVNLTKPISGKNMPMPPLVSAPAIYFFPKLLPKLENQAAISITEASNTLEQGRKRQRELNPSSKATDPKKIKIEPNKPLQILPLPPIPQSQASLYSRIMLQGIIKPGTTSAATNNNLAPPKPGPRNN